MKIAAMAIGLVLVACSDPRLDISFPIPESYSPEVDAVTLRVYEPPQAAPFTCEDLAFGLADPDVVRVSQVNEVLSRGDVPLTGINRLANKIFLGEATGDDGRRLLVGCKEVGAIDTTTLVELEPKPTTRVIVQARPQLSQPVGRPLPGPIVLRVTDARSADPEAGTDRPLLGAELRWKIIGAGGSGAQGSAESNAMGEVSITPTLPTRPGPYELELNVAWAERLPDPITGFISPLPESINLPARVLAYQPGRVGPNGEPGVAALLFDGARSVKVALVLRSPSTGQLLSLISPSIDAITSRLGLLDHHARMRDRAVVITESSWVEIGTDATLIPKAGYLAPLSPPNVVLPFGPCPPTDQPQLLVSYGVTSDTLNIYNADGTRESGFAGGIDLIGSGCVADQAGAQVRTLILDSPTSGLTIGAELTPDMFLVLQWFAVGFGMSFVEPTGNSPALLLGTQLRVNDFVVSRLGIRRLAADRFELADFGLDEPPEVPQVNRGGDIDGDDNLDVISLFARPSQVPNQPLQFAVWAALGITPTDHLSGDFDVGDPSFRVPELFVMDLDLDGIDDLVIAENNAADAGATQTLIRVYSMGSL